MNLRREGGAVADEESGGRVRVEDEDENDAEADEDDNCVALTEEEEEEEEETSLRRFDDGPSWTAPRKDARVDAAQTIAN
ncbi:hypothetical protein DTO021D3_1069 [Paecilomyces variotii]|nr:hypothetical protein DTO032I3_902 [Paecilomyces variotii]KAJ9282317.1 hypothetical protein DTO021D3_1069 [Paecilomyces variotii]KAJ9283702.1 hypothetical protein DTO021C3_8730 [Paecilomyces variotii]KAJ9343625.1 hypothetical protein DTO027B6_3843 [Paecilomyces variotii]KAJ9351048.1 hypothetical protein DTO027B9_6633 [Paecilomyces variotii]